MPLILLHSTVAGMAFTSFILSQVRTRADQVHALHGLVYGTGVLFMIKEYNLNMGPVPHYELVCPVNTGMK